MRYLTGSEMATWRRCRRRWWLSQYRGLRRRGDVDFGRPTGIGNRVHDALALYYDPALRLDPVQTVRDSVESDLANYPEHHDAVRKEGDLCLVMTEGYLEWLAETGEDQALTVVEAERARSAMLSPDRDVVLLAKLDARVHHDEYGRYQNLEHKTVSSMKQHLPELRLNTQVLTQHLVEFLATMEEGATAEEAHEQSSGVLFNMLLKSKRTARATPPFYGRTHVGHSMAELRNHWRHVLAVADEIATAETTLGAGGDHHRVCPPSPDSTCHWQCEFFRECVMFDNGDDVEGALAARFEVGDPLARYEGLLPGEVESGS